MPTKAADKLEIRAQRGTKRRCQNPECGSPYYDLNRDPITCPVCGTVYAPVPAQIVATRMPLRPQMKKRVYPVEPKPEDAPAEAEETVAVESDEEPAAAEEEADDTLIAEVEDDHSDVAAIIDAPIDDEKT